MVSDQSTAPAGSRPAPGARVGRGYRIIQQLESYLLLLPALLILALFFVWPALFNFLLSFRNISLFELAQGGQWAGLDNYVELAQDPLARLALRNTVLWLTGATVVLRIVLGLGLAVLLNAPVLRRWRLSALARSMVLIPWITPPVVAVAAWRWLLHPQYGALNQILVQTGLIDEGIPFLVRIPIVWWAIVAIVVWRELPFVVITLLAGLQSIPADLYDAGQVDGATRLQLFRYITLPMLRPVLVIVILLTTIWTYNNFVYVWLTTRGGPGDYTQVLATEMYLEAFTNYRLGYGATVGVLMSVFMMVFSIVYFVTVFRKSVGQRNQ